MNKTSERIEEIIVVLLLVLAFCLARAAFHSEEVSAAPQEVDETVTVHESDTDEATSNAVVDETATIRENDTDETTSNTVVDEPAIVHKNEFVKTTVNATVISREYVAKNTGFKYGYSVWSGKFKWKMRDTPEKYNVTIKYETATKTFDSRYLYDNYNEGDTIEAILYSSYDSKGEMYAQYIDRWETEEEMQYNYEHYWD